MAGDHRRARPTKGLDRAVRAIRRARVDPVKLLLVDADADLRGEVAAALNFRLPTVEVLAARDADGAARLFLACDPDLVLMDVQLPGRDGFELLREIRLVSDTPVIVVTARARETDLVKGLGLGADAYLAKPIGHPELLARVQAVLRRSGTGSPDAGAGVVVGDLRLAQGTRELWLRGGRVALTPNEHRLLHQLAANVGRLLPHGALIAGVWGDRDAATADSLKSLVGRLRAKIEPDADSPRYLESVRGLGYRLLRPPAA